jgi:hypothetical protein
MSNPYEHQPDTKIELIEYLVKDTKPRVSCCTAKIINYVQDVQEWQDSQTIAQLCNLTFSGNIEYLGS